MDALKSRVIKDQVPEDIWRSFEGLVYILTIWHAFRVAQLKSFNRWFSVVFFLFWTLVSIANVAIQLQRFLNHPRALFFVFVFDTLNIACVWYLTRTSFREFAVKYVTEYEQEKKLRDMQKFSQEQIRKGKF